MFQGSAGANVLRLFTACTGNRCHPSASEIQAAGNCSKSGPGVHSEVGAHEPVKPAATPATHDHLNAHGKPAFLHCQVLLVVPAFHQGNLFLQPCEARMSNEASHYRVSLFLTPS